VIVFKRFIAGRYRKEEDTIYICRHTAPSQTTIQVLEAWGDEEMTLEKRCIC
jgi:hypothetical protein